MNQRLFAASACLSDEALNADRQAFFKSVMGTLNHVMVGDIIWLKRFAVQPSSQISLSYITELEKPGSLEVILFNNLDRLTVAREKIDEIIIRWIDGLSETDLTECLAYKNMAGKLFKKPYASLISHLFMHQIHHRGQATTLLSQLCVDFGDTDLVKIISECVS